MYWEPIPSAEHDVSPAQRILHTDYALPQHCCVSPECRDLLGRILVADPAARISLADIQQHPWFLAELPEGCHDMNARLLEEPPEPEVQVDAMHMLNPTEHSFGFMKACWSRSWKYSTMVDMVCLI